MRDYNYINKLVNNIPGLNADQKQDILIKVFENIDSYDESKGKLSTWISKVAKNHLIDENRRAKSYGKSAPIPFSYFDSEYEDGAISNIITDKLACNEFIPDSGVIYSEFEESILNRVKMLPDTYRDIAYRLIEGDEIEISERLNVHRMRVQLMNTDIENKTKYVLTNIYTGERIEVKTFEEGAKIFGMNWSSLSNALKNNKLFCKKRWKIETK